MERWCREGCQVSRSEALLTLSNVINGHVEAVAELLAFNAVTPTGYVNCFHLESLAKSGVSTKDIRMKLVLWPVLIAFLVQFGTLPFLIGARTAGEIIGWPLIMALFFGVPSVVVYFAMFTVFRAMSPPPWLAVMLGTAIPAAIVLGVYNSRGVPLDLSPKNWMLWMGVIGGLAGTATYLHLRTTLTSSTL